MATATVGLTTEEFLALPESDRVERWLIEGELVEWPMSRRSPPHCNAVAQLSKHLGNWIDTLTPPRPKVYSGDIYFQLRRDPDTDVGIDVAVASAEQVTELSPDPKLIFGPPILAIEVISPSDRVRRVKAKAQEFLKNGTKMVWIVDPYDFAVTVYRTGAEPMLFPSSKLLTGDPELPGFSVKVGALFE